MQADQVEALFEALSDDRPDPQTELVYHNPFTLLVAVVLSAQATDVGVNKATEGLFARASNPSDMAALGEDQIREAIKSLGLYRNKATNVYRLSEILRDQYNGDVPNDRAALESLPGVGRKTANVVLNEIFGHETLAVDTHIFRVANRTGLANGKTTDAVEQQLLKIVPKRFLKGAHHWLILHGRYVCKARKPNCSACAIHQYCTYPDKTAG